MLGDHRELAITTPAHRHAALAPGALTGEAWSALAAALQRKRRQPVADLDAGHVTADLDHIP